MTKQNLFVDSKPDQAMNVYLVLIFLLVHLSSRHINGQIRNVCNICKCSDKVIDCDGRGLIIGFQSRDWKAIAGPNSTFEEINLSNNNLGRVFAFPTLPVTKLILRNNRIVKIDNRAFKNLTRLVELDLSENEIATANLVPNVFQGSFSAEYYEPLPIKHLDLSGNELHSLNALIFEHLPNLQWLSLKKNPFRMLDKSTIIAISSLQALEVLDLSFTKLRELPTGFLHSVKNLKELLLKGNYLKEIPGDVLYESHNLVELNLNYNPIEVISTERPFPEMPSLKRLHISYMGELRRIDDFSLHGLTGLDHLECKQNEKLEFVSPLAFALNESDTNRPNVTQLEMSDNSLHYLNKSFLQMDKMHFINLLGNSWSCDCENQWMITELVPILVRTHSPITALRCSEPPAMKNQDFLSLYKSNHSLRCLDIYGNNPENDSVILISVFSIIIILMVVGLVIVWKIKVGTCRRGGRIDYSRAFYRPAESDDKY